MNTRLGKRMRVAIGYRIILLLRTQQDKLYVQITIQQKRIEDLPEGSFRALAAELAYHWSKTLYWFCVANAWVKDPKPRKE